jgi:hypothetical protein
MQTAHNYVSVLFANLLQPIVDLFDLMEQKEPKGPNEVQASKAENGYAASIAVLTALVIESVCNRVRYVRDAADRAGAVPTLKKLSAPDMLPHEEVEDWFARRDGLADDVNRIHRQTAIAALQKCVEVLRFLENADLRFVAATDPHVIWQSRPVAFYRWADELQVVG